MKLGFIVEGDAAKAVLEELIPRLLPAGRAVEYGFVRLGGRAGLSTAYTSAIVLLSKNSDHVFIVFDAGSTLPAVVAEQKERVFAGVREYRLEADVTVCPAIPTIESWLLAGLRDQDPFAPDPTKRLGSMLGHPFDPAVDGPGLVAQLDLELASRRNESFAQFAEALASVVTPAPGIPVTS